MFRSFKWFITAGIAWMPFLPPAMFAADTAGMVPLVLHEAIVEHFDALVDDGGQTVLRWETTYENGSGVFLVQRQYSDGHVEPVGSGYLRLRGGDELYAYEFADPDARAGDAVQYALIFAPHGDEKRQVAEWQGVLTRAPASRIAVTKRLPAAVTPAALAPLVVPKPWIGNGPRVRTWSGSSPADRVRLSLREQGLYRVTAQELADAGGWDVGDMTTAIATTNLAMTCQGEPIAWLADGEALLFYGVPTESRYAPENVYWVVPGQGTAMAHDISALPPLASTNVWFMDTIMWQGTNYLERLAFCSLADTPASFAAFSRPLLNGESKTFAATLPDCAFGIWEGTVIANLLSCYEVGTDDHLVQISLGGTALGTVAWSDEKYVPFSCIFSSTNLNAGSANLMIENIAPPPDWDVTDYTRFLGVSFVFTYRRRYLARDGALSCTGGTGNVVAVAGFATNDIVVLDVTDPRAPLAMQPVAAVWDANTEVWTATFASGGTEKIYQVCSRAGGLLQPSVRGVRDTDWSQPGLAPQYAILVPPEAWRDDFRETLQPLADFRNAQGLRTEIIDVEKLYNAYSYGLVDPWAIRQFCAATFPNGLRYLLLAGSGSLDYKYQRLSVNDFPACLIPSPVAGQRFPTGQGRIVTLDAALGDADGDGRPDVAVGRLPSSQTNELAVAVSKTIAYEGALTWKRQASITADWDSIGDMYYPFSTVAGRLLAPLAAAGRLVVTHYVYSQSAGTIVRNNSLFPALLSGSGLFYFFGHSSNVTLGYSTTRLLYRTDMDAPKKWHNTPIAIVMGCIPNRWQSMTPTVSILPYGLFAADTGFVAALGATGDMLPSEGKDFAAALLTETGGLRLLRLGDVILRGIRQVAAVQPAERLLSVSLIGDPALVYRHDVTSTGTDVAWLAARELVAPNADLADPDQDGWPTWQEYSSGTDPLGHLLRITDARLASEPVRTITFESASNTLYQVQSSLRLDGDAWQVVLWRLTNTLGWNAPETPISPQGPITTVTVPATNRLSSGFYRIRSVE